MEQILGDAMATQNLSDRLPTPDSTTLQGMNDVGSYSGQAEKTVVVNDDENGLTYAEVGSGGGGDAADRVTTNCSQSVQDMVDIYPLLEFGTTRGNYSIGTPRAGTNAWVNGVDNAPGKGFWGFCLLPNNKVFCVPYYHTLKKCIFNPETNMFEDTVNSPPQHAFIGGCLMPDGRVFITPNGYTGTNILYNPESNAFESVASSCPNTGFTYGSVLLPNGKVFMVPNNNSSNTLLYNPQTGGWENVNSSINGAFTAGCLMPNGKVFMAPSGYTGSTMIYNPDTNDFEDALSNTGGNSFNGAILLPSGKVFCVPYNYQAGAAGLKLIYNPETNDFESISGTRPAAGYSSGCLMTNGKVLMGAFSRSDVQIYNPDTNELEAVSVTSDMGALGQYGAVSLADGRCFSLAYGYSGKQYLFEPEGMGETPYGDYMLEPYFNKF